MSVDGKIPDLRRTKEGRNLGLGRCRAIRAAGQPRRGRGGDPPAPWQHRLIRRRAVGVGQTVARHLLHQDERIEHHRLPARLKRPDPLEHRAVGRGATIDRRGIALLHHGFCSAPRQPADPPFGAAPVKLGLLDLGPQAARSAAQVIAEPAHHQRGCAHVGAFRDQLVERGVEIAAPRGRVDIGHPRLARAIAIGHRRGGQGIFAGAGNQRHAAQVVRHLCRPLGRVGLHRLGHLEAELRHPVAKGREVKLFQHHIGGAAIGRHRAAAFDRLDLGIRQLIGASGIDPEVQILGRDFLAIGPDPANPADLALADRNRQAGRIGIGGCCHLGLRGRALATAAATGLGIHVFGKGAGPDHMPRHPRAAIAARHRRALTGAIDPKPVDAVALNHHLRSLPHQPLVDGAPDRGADEPADSGHRQAQERAADGAAKRGTGGGKNDCRHQVVSSGKANRAAMRRAQGPLNGLSITP